MRKQCGAHHRHNMPVRVPASEKIAGGSSLLEPFGDQADSPNHFSVYLHAFVSIHLAHSIIHSCPLPPPSLAPSPITNGWWSSLRCDKTARSRGCTALLMTSLGEVCFIIHPSPSSQHTHFLSHAAPHRGRRKFSALPLLLYVSSLRFSCGFYLQICPCFSHG